jgi:hypothetical protein
VQGVSPPNVSPPDDGHYRRSAITAVAALGTVSLITSFLESPIERTTRLWDDDPGISVPRLSIAPVAGGGALSLSGSF